MSALVALVALAAPGAVGAEPAPEEQVDYYASNGKNPAAAAVTLAQIQATPAYDTGYRPTKPTPLAGGTAACPPKRCKDYRLAVPRDVKVTDSLVRVLLPRGYKKSKRRYPVIYLFNGAVSAYDGWSRKTQLKSMSRSMKAIFVMPEGGYGRKLGMYTDWQDGSYDWETFHTKILVPWVDRKFRTVKGARAAVGASVSAIAAIGYAANHPGMFKAVLTLSGMMDTRTLVGNVLPQEVADDFGITQNLDLKRVWGNPVLDRDVWAAHNPAQLAPKLKDVKVFVSTGTGYPAGDVVNDFIHSGYTESIVFSTHRTFFAALTAAGVDYEARLATGNLHDWPYFDGPMRWGLPRLIRAALR